MMVLFSRLSAILLLALSLSVQAVEHLRLSTTTSTDNSGLMSVLNPAFEKKYGVKIDVIAVGTGKALKIGSRGDVDAVFVHAPAAELKYIASSDFIERRAVMHNDFVLIGPESDSAGIGDALSVEDALKKIMDSEAKFVSRGDDSGTHKKERALWKHAGISPTGRWYIQAGQGMGAVIKIADEMRAYTLTDRGTQIAFEDKSTLKVLYQGDPPLFNPYHIMAVNPERHPHVNHDLAMKYIEFITGEEGQALIRSFRIKSQPLFYPDAIQ
jgi:tungstate transport system substrate-binding protein